MRVSLNWLQEFVDLDLTPEALAETLTIAGFEVEEIEYRRRFAEGVVVGKVLECNQHPNADKLTVCQVDIGNNDPLNIVCGAANVGPEIYVPVATIGSYLPVKDLKIKRNKLRGVASEGMICSLAELGLEKESEGIHIFTEENLTLGEPVYPILGLDDVVLDLTTTANRADALSMVGVAREVAALTSANLTLPNPPKPTFATSSDSVINVQVTETSACPAYIGTEITNLKLAPSPQWLQRRLQAAGVRPINNVVDITNYVLLEWGQPLHAFDRERLKSVAGSDNLTLGVRLAQAGETLTTLDGQSRELQSENLIITANDVPVALAGVMGGENTEVNDQTQNIVLEAALFEPATVRRSARAQGVRTEASTRYERGVNQAELETATQRAIALLVELAQGSATQQAVADSRPTPDQWQRHLTLRLDRIHQVLGAVTNRDNGQLAQEDVERILTALGCELTAHADASSWTVTVPAYRYHDLEREIDLIEEIARLYGYDYFGDTLPEKTQPGTLSFRQKGKNQIREAMRAVGLTEVLHYSLVKPQGDAVVLANPLFQEYSALRTELLSGLINAFSYNLSRGNGPLNAFEIGRRFWQGESGLGEADTVAGIMGGEFFPGGRWINSGQAQAMSWYQAKGLLEAAFTRLGLSVSYQATEEDERLHPGRTAILSLDDQRLGIFGQLHPQFRQQHDLPEAVYVFSFDLEVLLDALAKQNLSQSRFSPFSTYPAVARDIAFYAPIDLPVADLIQAMEKAGGNLLENIELFDEYRGENVPEGQRSLAFSLTYQAPDRTLTDEEVEPLLEKVRSALTEQFAVTLRS